MIKSTVYERWFLIVLGLFLAACQSTSQQNASAPTTSKAQPSIPSFSIIEKTDVSTATARRLRIKVSIAQHLEQPDIERIANAIVNDATRANPVNAIAIFFYGPNGSTTGAYDVASVEWAPNGRWEEASSVRSGDYSSFRYSVKYKPALSSSDKGLKRSGAQGLFGIPLPEGAKLQTRKATQAGDSSESYSSNASAVDLHAFFLREMAASGWKKDGLSQDLVLFFAKGKILVQITIAKDGRRFSLAGS